MKNITLAVLLAVSLASGNKVDPKLIDSLTEQERTYLKEHPVILAHNESNWPPFNYNNNGTPQGFSVDYMLLLVEKLGIKVKYVNGYSWGEFIQMLPTDKLDVIMNISITEDRKKTIAFTSPFMKAKNAIYISTGANPLYTLKELEGKKVALVKDFFIQKYISKHNPGIKQVLVPDLLGALEMLSLKKVDAVVGKQVVVDYLMRENLISGVTAVDYIKKSDTISQLAIGTDINNKILVDILEKAQKSIDRETLSRLKHKWFGINALLNTKELLTEDETKYLKGKDPIRVCTQVDDFPFEFRRDGELQGISMDVFRTITNRLGVNLSFVESSSFADLNKDLQEGKCDMILGSAKSSINLSYASFTQPYLSYKTVMITQNGVEDISQLSKLGEIAIAGCKDDPVIERLKKSHPELIFIQVDSREKALEAVEKGKAYFTALPMPAFEYYKKMGNFSNIKVSGYAPVKSELSIAARKNEPKLFEIFNKIILATPKETYRAISEKWTKETIVKQIDYSVILKVLGVALLILGMMLLAYRKEQKLNKEIEKLNKTLESRIEEELAKNKEQQALMLHQDRLARMGEMIAMIAHQWRQPLNNLALVNQVLVTKYKRGQLDAKEIDNFKNNSKKLITQMSETIDDFRNFYEPKKEKGRFCIEEIVSETTRYIAPSLRKNKIEVLILSEDCIYFEGYANELQHAIMNIINNSYEALLENNVKEKKITIEITSDDNDILIRIQDNAGGIEEDIAEKIFEPYFSTKNKKNGTGLGLYMSKVIIVEHFKSDLSFRNIDGGAEFLIRLNNGD